MVNHWCKTFSGIYTRCHNQSALTSWSFFCLLTLTGCSEMGSCRLSVRSVSTSQRIMSAREASSSCVCTSLICSCPTRSTTAAYRISNACCSGSSLVATTESTVSSSEHTSTSLWPQSSADSSSGLFFSRASRKSCNEIVYNGKHSPNNNKTVNIATPFPIKTEGVLRNFHV